MPNLDGFRGIGNLLTLPTHSSDTRVRALIGTNQVPLRAAEPPMSECEHCPIEAQGSMAGVA